MYQSIVGGTDQQPSTSAVEYNNLMGGKDWTTGNGAPNHQVIPTGGTISSLRINLKTAPGAGKSYAFALMLNGVASALTCTVSDTDTTASDVSNSVAISASDLVSIRCTPSGTPAATKVRWSTVFQGTTAGESICLISSFTYSLGNRFGALQYSETGYSGTEARVKCPIPTPGTFKKLYVVGQSAPGAGTSYTITFRLNGASQSLSVQIANAATSGNDSSNTVAVVPDDLANILIAPAGSPSGMTYFTAGLVFAPTTDGEALLFGGMGGNAITPSQSAVNYKSIPGGGDWTATEADAQALIAETTVKRMYVSLSVAPGASKSYRFDVRKNGVNTGMATTLSGTSVKGYDMSITFDTDAGDRVGIMSTPTGTPAETWVQFGLVLATDPVSQAPVAPTVTTDGVADIAATTATANGTVTSLNGTVSQHGHCWATTTNPTTSDSKTTNGVKASTGPFTSAVTGLTEGTGYYIRAYATNEYGTGYGINRYFIAGDVSTPPTGNDIGEIWLSVDTAAEFHHIGIDGVDYTHTGV